jgi:hypothetical protein
LGRKRINPLEYIGEGNRMILKGILKSLEKIQLVQDIDQFLALSII